MRTWFHSWRAAIRIARRDAWRNKGRSFLVLSMIALPILGVSAMDLTIRSASLSAEETLDRDIGRADARFTDASYGGAPLLQDPAGDNYLPAGSKGDGEWPEGPGEIEKSFPPGATVLADNTSYGKLRTEHGLLLTEIRELKAADPAARGIMRLRSGRFPERGGEVAATTHFLESGGLKVGSKLTARGLDRDYRIVGSYELPSALDTNQVNAVPGAFLAPLEAAMKADGLFSMGRQTSYLVSVSGGFTWNMVQKINTRGISVVSRAVILNPPADADVPLFRHEDWNGSTQSSGARAAELAAIATIVGLTMLEICLLAGPAFAVGARSSRRQLGLVGANGGARSHIRAIVLSGGLVIGIASAVIGTVLGIALTIALRPLLEGYLAQRFDGIVFRPLELIGIALLAVLTGLLAAIVPAVTASRQTVLASLTGRRGVRGSNRVLPVVGLVAFVIGAVIALYGSTVTDRFMIVAGGSALAELGVVAMTPALVGLFGRVGRWLPLSPRLALRDAVRNRGRTAPAVAAVLAAVAGTVAVSTYATSYDVQRRAGYEAQLPHGTGSALVTESVGQEVSALRTALGRTLPVEVRADVDRISVGKPTCSMYTEGDGCGRYEVVVPKAHQCPLWNLGPGEAATEKFSKAERQTLVKDWRCKEETIFSYVNGGVLVGDEKILTVLGIDDPEARKALADGRVVAFDKRNIDTDGKIDIRLITDTEKADKAVEKGQEPPGEIKSFAAYPVPGEPRAYGLSMVIPPSAAKAAGVGTAPLGSYFTTAELPSDAQRQKLDDEIARIGSDAMIEIEKGYESAYGIVLLALMIFAGLITIGAAGIATGLAQADAEADLKTLAAVGAPARVRRTLSGFQCGVVAVMGVVLGSAAGVLPAIGLRMTERNQEMGWYRESLDQSLGAVEIPYVPIVVPWSTLGALLVAVPLGAALLAALVTRSHRTLGRRATA
ncbi:FtsX-like permease family protein [Streptomyces sp. NPDC087850]|uniref:FtsX-like permease family protein n=1 Tax=Streptomyces sp. NPDC087850 TaxID=3365809 RepID=UPI0037FBA535